jgi:hypothetical protein
MWRSGGNQGAETSPFFLQPVFLDITVSHIHLDFTSAAPVNNKSHPLFSSKIHASPYISTITVA